MSQEVVAAMFNARSNVKTAVECLLQGEALDEMDFQMSVKMTLFEWFSFGSELQEVVLAQLESDLKRFSEDQALEVWLNRMFEECEDEITAACNPQEA